MSKQDLIQYAQWRTDKPKEPGFSHELISQQYYDQYAHISDPDSLNLLPDNKLKTMYLLMKDLESRSPNQPFLGTKVRKPTGIEWEWITVKQMTTGAKAFASGMMALGLIPEVEAEGQKWRFIAIQAKNRTEWTITHLANMHCKATTIGLYDSLGDNETRFIVHQTQLKTIACSKQMVNRHLKLKMMDEGLELDQQKYATLKNIITYDEDLEPDVLSIAEKAGVKIYTYDQVMMEGERSLSDFVVQEPDEDDVFTISYTSGTTGNPKGVKVTHKALIYYKMISAAHPKSQLDYGTTLSFLPAAHIYEQINLVGCLLTGTQIAYYGGDPMKLISEDVPLVKPSILPMVPRILIRLYTAIKAKFAAATGCKKCLIDMALKTKLKNLRETGAVTHPCYDALIFNKVRAMLGGNVTLMASASAPISGEILDFLKVVFCCDIIEAYGLTETVGGLQTIRGDPITGHVGGPHAHCKIKFRDVPEMNISVNDTPMRGEICFAGPSVFKGYFKCPELTAEAFHNEWFCSGDIGQVNPNGTVKIIDRCKHIFKTQAGEYIAPLKLENIFVQSKWFDQVWIHGESLQSYVILFGVINPQQFQAWCKQNKELAYETTLKNENLIKEVFADVTRMGKEFGLNGLEKPKVLKLLLEPFSIENGLMTPTMKFKRFAAKMKFQSEINELYENGPNS